MEINCNVFILGISILELFDSSGVLQTQNVKLKRKVWLNEKTLEKKQKRFNIKNVNINVKLRQKN